MYRFVICAQPFAGHINPALPIARALVERGHDVRLLTGSTYRERVEATGARHVAPTHAPDLDGEDVDAAFPERTRLKGLDQFRFDISTVFLKPMPAQVADLEELLAAEPTDVLLCDPASFGGYAMHRKHGVRWATYGITVLSMSDPLVPPFGLGLRASSSPLALLRNRLLTTFTQKVLLRSLQTAADAAGRAAGLEPDGRWLFDVPLSPYLYLQPGVASLEYPRRHWPQQLHFVGGLLPPPPQSAELPSWWGDLAGAERVVLVTQGTVATDPEQLVVPTIRAFADDPGTLVVATIPGRSIESLSLRPLPGNARVAPFVPFEPLMPYVDAMVTNGGYGGVTCGLRSGVPLVVAGASEEKPEVARRVEYSGAGVDLRTGSPSPQQVRSGVLRVLTDPAYRAAAEKVSADLHGYDGPTLAANLLVELAETGKLVARTTPSLP